MCKQSGECCKACAHAVDGTGGGRAILRKENTLKGCKDFNLKAKVRIGPCLSDLCRVCSTAGALSDAEERVAGPLPDPKLLYNCFDITSKAELCSNFLWQILESQGRPGGVDRFIRVLHLYQKNNFPRRESQPFILILDLAWQGCD